MNPKKIAADFRATPKHAKVIVRWIVAAEKAKAANISLNEWYQENGPGCGWPEVLKEEERARNDVRYAIVEYLAENLGALPSDDDEQIDKRAEIINDVLRELEESIPYPDFEDSTLDESREGRRDPLGLKAVWTTMWRLDSDRRNPSTAIFHVVHQDGTCSWELAYEDGANWTPLIDTTMLRNEYGSGQLISEEIASLLLDATKDIRVLGESIGMTKDDIESVTAYAEEWVDSMMGED